MLCGFFAMGDKNYTPEERVVFDMYCAAILSMQYHPGAGTKEHVKLTARECADLAVQMLEIRRETIG